MVPPWRPGCADPLGGVAGVGVDVVLDHLAVGAEHRRVHQLDVQHRRVLAVGGAEVDALGQEDLAFEETPVGPHVHARSRRGRRGRRRRGSPGRPSHSQCCGCPGAGADDDLVARDAAVVGLHGGDRRPGPVGRVAGHLDAVDPLHAPLPALLVEPPAPPCGCRRSPSGVRGAPRRSCRS